MGSESGSSQALTLFEGMPQSQDKTPSELLEVRQDPLRERKLAALKGGAVAGLPTLAIVSLVPELYRTFFPVFWNTFSGFSEVLTPYLSLFALFSAPALLALPVAAITARTSLKLSRRSPDLGLAAAAGAGISVTAITVGRIFLHSSSLQDVILAAPIFAAGFLGIGVVGATTFSVLQAQPGRRQDPEDTPNLYPACIGAGLGGPALLMGGGLWALAIQWFPFLSPKTLAAFLGLGAGAQLSHGLTVALGLGGLAPVTFALALAIRRIFPQAKRGSILSGLLFPALIPALGILGMMLAPFSPVTMSEALMIFAGCMFGAVPHALAAHFGAGEPEVAGPRLLPDQSE